MDDIDAFTWVDDTSPDELLDLLRQYGVSVGSDDGSGLPPAPTPDDQDVPRYQLLPLGESWLRLEIDPGGRGMVGFFVPDARTPLVDDGRPPVRFTEDAPDLEGWLIARAEIDSTGRRWVSVLRRPAREAYVAVLYDAGESGPTRQLVIRGVYPDVTLVDDGALMVFIEPDRELPGAQRAVIAAADAATYEASRQVIAYAEHAGLGIKPCSVRRFFKISHGVRSERVWSLVDARQDPPLPILVPGAPRDPRHFDIALDADRVLLVQALDAGDSWSLQATVVEDGQVLHSWVCASGRGSAREVTSGEGYALVRVGAEVGEVLHRVPLAGYSSANRPLLSAGGLLDLSVNQVTPSIGFAATELSGGVPPFAWYFDNAGANLNDPAAVARRAGKRAAGARERVTSSDGYVFDLDLRWSAAAGDTYAGPVVLMLYGAYGLDLDLDTDPDLGLWLDHGFAVATPHVRGGGPERRHRAGSRANRERSLADTAAAVRHLKAGAGQVRATALVALGASAGGFLAATTLNTCPEEVDVCVIVNGFVDPMTSLCRRDTTTQASDVDEWGDPLGNPNDRAALAAVSPVDNLRLTCGAEALVVVSACDVRVNPRQGLKWFLRYTDLGGPADLWFDPQGAHDCWGAEMPRTALVDWVIAALQRRAVREATRAELGRAFVESHQRLPA